MKLPALLQTMKHLLTHCAFLLTLTLTVQSAELLRLTRTDYADRAHAAWVAQIAGVFSAFRMSTRRAPCSG